MDNSNNNLSNDFFNYDNNTGNSNSNDILSFNNNTEDDNLIPTADSNNPATSVLSLNNALLNNDSNLVENDENHVDNSEAINEQTTDVVQEIENNQVNDDLSNNNSNILQAQNVVKENVINDNDLLMAFVGEKYYYFANNSFNLSAFFFSSLYMCFRKMFWYGILFYLADLILLNIVNSFVLASLCNVILALFFNKFYLNYARKKIEKIKSKYSDKSNSELIDICSSRGGTSFINILLGFVVHFIVIILFIVILSLMNISNGSILGNSFSAQWDFHLGGNSVENVTVGGSYLCVEDSCTVEIDDAEGNSESYLLDVSDDEFFLMLSNYSEYVKLTIYYSENDDGKVINDYKIYLISNNENISNINNEEELREKIGLYSLGTHTDTLTLKEISGIGFSSGFGGSDASMYTEYIFVSNNNIEYEMKYFGDSLDVTEGEKYIVTFDVSKPSIDYEYNIKSVK